MKRVHWLVGALSLAGVAGIVAWEYSHRTSPGDLHPSHASVAKLMGNAGCEQCHGASGKPMVDACSACHHDIQDQIETGKGLHGSLKVATATACGACHREHNAGRMALVSARSFENVGVPDMRQYEHQKFVMFDLHGAHDKLRCEQCHTSASAEALKEGEKRFLGLSTRCVSCHEDSHKGAFGADCASCHGQSEEFKRAAGFVHTTAFALEGGHANLECARCHESSGVTSVAALLGTPQPVRDCVSCHEDVHKGVYGPSCASCHGTGRPFNQASEFKHTSAFPLTVGHANVACKECHQEGGSHSIGSLRAHPQPNRSCNACHASPHREDLIRLVAQSVSRPEPATCTECHGMEDESFLIPNARMTPAQHAGAGMSLALPHEKAKCEDCHKEMGKREAIADHRKARPQDLRASFATHFPGREPDNCVACHEDVHKGQFDSGWTHGRCVECHAREHFKNPVYDVKMHARCVFPLTGAHEAVACNACHKETDGKVRRFVPTATACAECHADVHQGEFDAAGRPNIVDGKVGCARCHGTSSFRDVAWTTDGHGLWTGYDLRGKHLTAKCDQCHARSGKPDLHGMTLQRAPKDCASCHQDVHAGQLARNNVTDCARCHQDTGEFKATTFDHQRDSVFKLDEAHVKLECVKCHRPVDVGGGVKVVRYKPLGTTCKDCHGPDELVPRRSKP